MPHASGRSEQNQSKTLAKTMDNNALVICGAQINPEREGKPKRALVKTRMNLLRSRLGRIMRRLYDLESGNEPEKPLEST